MKTTSPGIRQKENGRYVATKSIGKKRYYKEFDKERDAIRWKKDFHPLISSYETRKRIVPAATDQSNGKDKFINFGEVIEKYQKGFLKSLTAYTQYKKALRLSNFTHNLQAVPMCTMKPEIITNHLEAMTLLISSESRRCNFDKELKDISSIFNWYKDNIDFSFVNPVTKIHYKLGTIRDIAPKQKDMDEEEFRDFLNHLRPMYVSMVRLMYVWALRIGETAALSDEVVNLRKKEAFIHYVYVWMKGRPELKRGTKTGSDAKMPITEEIAKDIRYLQANRPKGCKLLFHHKGKPLRYDMILKEFNRALKEAGLPHSGTHIIRHTTATHTRKKHGLDHSQAILRHTTARMSEEYAKLDVNEKVNSVVIKLSDHLKSLATNCDREAISS